MLRKILLQKKLLDRSIVYGNVSFSPQVGLGGFRVSGQVQIEDITCKDLESEIHQLAILLYPPDRFNEKFLIKMRDCVLKLSEDHPLKRWLKSVGKTAKPSKPELEQRAFLSEILNSQFNLITDTKLKGRIIQLLISMPHRTLGERLLKSFLYLIIGNVTRSDNLLREFIREPPYQNWIGFTQKHSLYHQMASENIEQILTKLSRHPSDRKIYRLFAHYLQSFYRDESLLDFLSDHLGPSLNERIDLQYLERAAPKMINFLRLSNLDESQRLNRLRDTKIFPLEEQAYWIWPFFNIDPLISESMLPVLHKIEKEDHLWFIYLMDNEKLTDMYFKNAPRTFLHGRRQYLRQLLNDRELFMLALFKLIEFGDIDMSLVNRTADYLTHE